MNLIFKIFLGEYQDEDWSKEDKELLDRRINLLSNLLDNQHPIAPYSGIVLNSSLQKVYMLALESLCLISVR